ncbi:hypothetical protein SXIM_20530 [Streptomyces xiamenensis]|uniref:Uncharacterized protein n=1 Tax=Streptomyces xiamenensis TaxID=408015 RepID=A0A0F7FT85_9ACTN|nr:hypothetical protein [Streptomyces xiamenensis]AKG43437.1 hypothetical protein SXIM_20530 [Streptomyces xiamenensis]
MDEEMSGMSEAPWHEFVLPVLVGAAFVVGGICTALNVSGHADRLEEQRPWRIGDLHVPQRVVGVLGAVVGVVILVYTVCVMLGAVEVGRDGDRNPVGSASPGWEHGGHGAC